MVERARKLFSGAGEALLTVGLLKLLSYYQHVHLLKQSKPVEVPGLENSLLLLILGLLMLLPRRHKTWACGALLLLHQTLAFVDTVYYRFFNDLPSLHLLPLWFQAGRASESLAPLVALEDLRLLLPVTLYAMLLLPLRRLEGEGARDPRVGAAVVLLGLVSFLQSWHSMHPVRHTQLQRRFQNIAISKLFGPVFYHYYDAYEWGRVELGLEGGTAFDPELVDRVVGRSRQLSTALTPFRGRYQGRDLIFVQLESLEHFALDAEFQGRPVMPFLQRARRSVHSFKLFDQTHLGRSADGQFIFLNSLHPPATRPLPFTYPTNEFHGLPRLFQEKGYRTLYLEPSDPGFWNTSVLSEAYGFQERYYEDDLKPRTSSDVRGWGLTDAALYEHAVELGENSPDPYFMYLVTVMCHHPYSESSNPPVDFPPKKPLNMVRRYLRCAAVRDHSLERLVKRLARTERGRRTVLCLVGDHDANLPTAEMKALGYPTFPDSEAVPMLLGSVEEFLALEPRRSTPPAPRSFGAQMDVAPSLGHVFSLNMEESVFVGWNLFATQNRGPHHSRVGTWMDLTGRIQELENPQDSREEDLFRASEMLLQGDKIRAFGPRG